MLDAGRTTHLPVALAAELFDALNRRQKELPPRWLAAAQIASARFTTVKSDLRLDVPKECETMRASLRAFDVVLPGASVSSTPRHAFEAVERSLGLALVADHLGDGRPRSVVCIRPSASDAHGAMIDALRARGTVAAIAAIELDEGLSLASARRIIDRSAVALPDEASDASKPAAVPTVAPITCDCTVELPLPAGFPRPRVYLCLGNALGATTTVGAVRTLRVLRSTMAPGDSVILGLDTRSGDTASSAAARTVDDTPLRHMGALALLRDVFGADFDVSRFSFESRYDAENRRFETHLVARQSLTLGIPGECHVRLKKGESIRTSVHCAFDRNRFTAMLTGVGLSLRTWTADSGGQFAVALAIPSV